MTANRYAVTTTTQATTTTGRSMYYYIKHLLLIYCDIFNRRIYRLNYIRVAMEDCDIYFLKSKFLFVLSYWFLIFALDVYSVKVRYKM